MGFIFFISIKIINKKEKKKKKKEKEFKYFEKCSVKEYCDKREC